MNSLTEDNNMNDNPLGLDETKPELSENESSESIYKENESQNQGEYHQPENAENQSYCRPITARGQVRGISDSRRIRIRNPISR